MRLCAVSHTHKYKSIALCRNLKSEVGDISYLSYNANA